jgi:hypothetical protein
MMYEAEDLVLDRYVALIWFEELKQKVTTAKN